MRRALACTKCYQKNQSAPTCRAAWLEAEIIRFIFVVLGLTFKKKLELRVRYHVDVIASGLAALIAFKVPSQHILSIQKLIKTLFGFLYIVDIKNIVVI